MHTFALHLWTCAASPTGELVALKMVDTRALKHIDELQVGAAAG